MAKNFDTFTTSFPTEFDYHLTSSDAYKTVNAGVFYALNRYQAHSPIRPIEADGCALYPVMAPGKVPAQIYVVHIAPTVARMMHHFLAPLDPIERIKWQQEGPPRRAIGFFQDMLRLCNAGVTDLLRSRAQIEAVEPPPPPKSDPVAVIIWQSIYFPDMTEKELGQRVGLDPQRLYNLRTELGLQKRTLRTPRGNKPTNEPPNSRSG